MLNNVSIFEKNLKLSTHITNISKTFQFYLHMSEFHFEFWLCKFCLLSYERNKNTWSCQEVVMYLAADCRPEALCTWTTRVTTREAAPLLLCPSGLTGRCLYRMHTSSRPKKHNRSVTTIQQSIILPLLCVSVYLRAEAGVLWGCPSWESGAARTFEPH